MDLHELLAWIPLAAAGISALGSLGGSFMSAQGAAQANAQNVAMQNMANQQMLNAQMAQHQQNTGFMEDSQAHQLWSQHLAQDFSMHEAEKARAFNSIEARVARDTQNQFQERMATNAYRYAMMDMKAAGLNPILAYQQGGAPAGSGSGAAASGPAASSSGGSAGMSSAAGPPNLRAANVLNTQEAIGRAMGNLVSSAMSVLQSHADIDRIKADEKEKEERAKVHTYDAVKKDMETIKIGREAEKVLEEKELVKAQTKNAKTLNQVIGGEAENMSRYGRKEAPDTIERILRTIQGAVEQHGGKLE